MADVDQSNPRRQGSVQTGLINGKQNRDKTVGRSKLMGTVLVAGMLTLFALRAPAHTLPISYVFVVTDQDYVHLELSFNPFELAGFTEFDANKNGRLDPEELSSPPDQLTRQILDHLILSADGKPVAPENAGIAPDADSHHATLRAHYRVNASRAALTLESRLPEITSSSHLSQVNFLRDGKPQLAQLDSQSRHVTFSVATPVAAGAPSPLRAPICAPAGGESATVALGAVVAFFLLAARRQAKRNPTATPPANPSPLNPPPTL